MSSIELGIAVALGAALLSAGVPFALRFHSARAERSRHNQARSLARREWCEEQRAFVDRFGHAFAMKVADDDVEWAVWGAARGYFELRWRGGAPYLTQKQRRYVDAAAR